MASLGGDGEVVGCRDLVGDDVLGGEVVADALAGAVQPTHDGADGDAERISRLLVRQSLEIDEFDHRMEPAREIIECCLHGGVEHRIDDLALGVIGFVGGGREPLEIHVRVTHELRTSPPDPVALGVAHDGEQPCPGEPTVEAVDRPVGANEGFLDQVLGVDGVPGDRRGDAQEHRDLGEHVGGEGVVGARRIGGHGCTER